MQEESEENKINNMQEMTIFSKPLSTTKVTPLKTYKKKKIRKRRSFKTTTETTAKQKQNCITINYLRPPPSPPRQQSS